MAQEFESRAVELAFLKSKIKSLESTIKYKMSEYEEEIEWLKDELDRAEIRYWDLRDEEDIEDSGFKTSKKIKSYMSDDDEYDLEPAAPEEDDLVTDDYHEFYQYDKLVIKIDPEASTDEMWEEIDRYMEKTQFWPNVWFISDHGNTLLMGRE